MKFIIILSIIIFIAFGFLTYAAFNDTKNEGICTGSLEGCLNDCPKEEMLKGGYCVLKCSLGNVVCLVVED